MNFIDYCYNKKYNLLEHANVFHEINLRFVQQTATQTNKKQL